HEKIIIDLGATGNQGGAVVELFLREGGWQIRAATQDLSGTKARPLSGREAELIQADFDHPKTLVPVFKNANVIFAVTNFRGLYFDPINKDNSSPGEPLNL
ncbi:uncharacterized protein A1O9_12888, partial [Exophiala aquamarina CBS 119918]